MSFKRINTFLFTILLLVISDIVNGQMKREEVPNPMYGITVDDSWQGEDMLQEIISAINAMSVKPTVRIVMSSNIPPKDYKETFKTISKIAYVLAQPVDSYYMRNYKNVSSYLRRFQDSYKELNEYVDLWEIANEINGEGWLGGSREFNAEKMYAAYKYIHENGGKTVLTGYEVAPGDQEMSMLEWMQKYVPQDMKRHLDYFFISYYEDDHHGYQPDWEITFKKFENIFPNAKLAIGECGNTSKDATIESKLKMIRHYYLMPKYVNSFIGGYFWWNWVQDCVPHEKNSLWHEINNCFIKTQRTLIN